MDDPILNIEEREAINAGRWFSSLSPSLRHDILRCAYVKRCKDGDLIAARGDPAEEWMACARGAVRVSSTSLSGKQITFTYVEPGIWFGDVAILDGDRRTHDVYAHGDTTILCVAKADFQKILSQHVEFYEAMLRLQARRIRQLFGLVEDLNTLPLRSRLAKQLRCTELDQCARDSHWLASCTRRTRTTLGCITPTREPRAQSHGARGSHSHRAGRLGDSQPRRFVTDQRSRPLTGAHA
jgi:signal-transduction protein with cAMP-binding, CBS, and nucleotidyltransferase domain